MAEHDILKVETVEVRHPAHPELERHAKHAKVSLDDEPTEIKSGAFSFLIFGSDPCVYFNERENEVGHAARAWAEAYAETGKKPDSPQHDGSEVFYVEEVTG